MLNTTVRGVNAGKKKLKEIFSDVPRQITPRVAHDEHHGLR